MTTTHSFQLRGTWSGDKMSVGEVETDTLKTSISIPSELGGPGIGTNPEHLLVSAASACYLMTFAAILTNRKIPFVRIDLETEGFVLDDKGLRFDRLEHRPTLVVSEEIDRDRVQTLAEHAEHACMISSAVRGNVAVTVRAGVMLDA